MKTLLAALVLAALAAPASALAAERPCGGRHLATIEADAKVSSGSREAVVAAARKGEALRVGWQIGPAGKPDLEHWQDARFITIFEGQVFAQIGDIHHQFGKRGKAQVDVGKSLSFWNASIGTDGRMMGRLSDQAEPTTMALRTYWCRSGA